MNLLATLDELKRSIEMDLTVTTYDVGLTIVLQQVSRLVEQAAGRSFFPEIATRYQDGDGTTTLWLTEPWLEITTVSLSADLGATYTALAGTDWWASDGLVWDRPPYQLLALNPNGDYASFYKGQRSVKIVGILGWHPDYANAWEASGDSIQDTGGITAVATTVTVADADGADARGLTPRFSVGNLAKAESEYMAVTGIATNVLTVRRGWRGSTAATHTKSTALAIWRPELTATEAAKIQAARLFKRGQQAFADAGASVELGRLLYVKRLDPDVEAILMGAGLRRLTVG